MEEERASCVNRQWFTRWYSYEIFALCKLSPIISPLLLSAAHFGSLHLLHLMRELKSGHGFPPGPAFCRILRVRNRPPRLHVPRHSLQPDHAETLQFSLNDGTGERKKNEGRPYVNQNE